MTPELWEMRLRLQTLSLLRTAANIVDPQYAEGSEVGNLTPGPYPIGYRAKAFNPGAFEGDKANSFEERTVTHRTIIRPSYELEDVE